MERYELELASLPYDLTFRAYDANCEAAWYGTEGVLIRLNETGSYAVSKPISYKESGAQSKVCVREIICEGRVIYRKLEPIPIQEAKTDANRD